MNHYENCKRIIKKCVCRKCYDFRVVYAYFGVKAGDEYDRRSVYKVEARKILYLYI